jgi:hypothetical protein
MPPARIGGQVAKSPRVLRSLIYLSVSILVLCVPAVATTLIGLRTPDGFIIAVDSKATYRGTGIKGSPTVCKIFQLGSLYFAVAGLAEDRSRKFSPERIVANNVSFADSLTHNMDMLERAFSDSLESEMEGLKAEDPDNFAFNQKPGVYTLSIMAGEMVRGSPQMSARGFMYHARSPKITISRLDCPGEDCSTGTKFFFAGEADIAMNMAKDFFRSTTPRDPVADARGMIEAEIQAVPENVGPPITILRVDKNGASWPSNDSGCPIVVTPPTHTP